ncbi:exosome complex component RRP40-like protein, partial [Leptotrombidium deliense]
IVEEQMQEIVVPGEELTQLMATEKANVKKIVVGPGIRRDGERFFATKCGRFKSRENPCIFWIDYHQKRYIPVRGERIIGIVTQKGGFHVKVDIGTNEAAVLSLLAFEGATKRNKPFIQVGDLVYTQVLSINDTPDGDTELVCVNSKGKKNGMGVLPDDGFMVTVPINVARRLLSPDCLLLRNLGTKFKYEIAVGLNGRVWIRGSTRLTTEFIVNTVNELEYLTEQELYERTEAILNEFEVYNKK